MIVLTPLLEASIAANVLLAILCVAAWRRKSGAQAPAAAPAAAKEARAWETRIERLEVLWYPVVNFSPDAKKVLKVTSGLPHCKACARALSLQGKSWTCPQCAAEFPETLADVAITDMITKQALKHFLERHKDFRTT